MVPGSSDDGIQLIMLTEAVLLHPRPEVMSSRAEQGGSYGPRRTAYGRPLTSCPPRCANRPSTDSAPKTLRLAHHAP